MNRKMIISGCLSSLGLIFASGCYHERVVYTDSPPQSVVYVEGAPPPAEYVEVIPPRPRPGVIWYKGQWQRHGHEWRWHHGHWH